MGSRRFGRRLPRLSSDKGLRGARLGLILALDLLMELAEALDLPVENPIDVVARLCPPALLPFRRPAEDRWTGLRVPHGIGDLSTGNPLLRFFPTPSSHMTCPQDLKISLWIQDRGVIFARQRPETEVLRFFPCLLVPLPCQQLEGQLQGLLDPLLDLLPYPIVVSKDHLRDQHLKLHLLHLLLLSPIKFPVLRPVPRRRR